MRFLELICFSVVLALFSILCRSQLFQVSGFDNNLKRIKKQSDSLIFISGSFKNACKGKGFSSLDEWVCVCYEMWDLEKIEWSYLGKAEDGFFYGSWEGPFGNGEVYAEK